MGAKYPSLNDVEKFQQMLFADTFRGPHSTGVHSIFRGEGGKGTTTVTRKAACTGADFVDSELWDQVSEMKLSAVVGATVKRPNIMIGHNRWATRGAVNARNAHPFTSGHITLAHNGTLVDQALLPNHKNYEVDSENIAHAMEVWGTEKTIQNLDGAFTLIWHNALDNTVNIIRNKERPFYLVRTTGGDWFGASEKDMLLWILKRQKVATVIAEEFECEVGVQYMFDVTNGDVTLKGRIKHELPKFEASYDYGHYSGWYRDYSVSNSTLTVGTFLSKKEEDNHLLKKNGVNAKVDDFITFSVDAFEQYRGETPYGKMTGYLDPFDTWVCVVVNGFLKDNFTTREMYKGKILSVRAIDGYLEITAGLVEKTDKEIDVILIKPPLSPDQRSSNTLLKAEGVDAEVGGRITFNGMSFSSCQSGTIGTIRGYLHPAVGYINVVGINSPEGIYSVGGHYEATVLSANIVDDRLTIMVNNVAKTKDLRPTQTFDVTINQPLMLEDLTGEEGWETFFNSDVPTDESEDDEMEVASLKSGEVFTRKKWKESGISDCSCCSSPIPFEDLSRTELLNGYTFCEECLGGDSSPFGNPTPVTSIYFSCRVCNKRLPNAKNSGDGTCTDCKEKHEKLSRKVLSLRKQLNVQSVHPKVSPEFKTLHNGMKVSEVMWNVICNCKICRKEIPWDISDKVIMVGGVPLCTACESKVG